MPSRAGMDGLGIILHLQVDPGAQAAYPLDLFMMVQIYPMSCCDIARQCHPNRLRYVMRGFQVHIECDNDCCTSYIIISAITGSQALMCKPTTLQEGGTNDSAVI